MAETTTTRLVLIRAGESEGIDKNVLNGWFDADLTRRGYKEAEKAGQFIKLSGITFDESYTSDLLRANNFLTTVLTAINQTEIPVTKTWKLNDQHYGELTGLSKEEYQKKYGEDFWKNEYNEEPPKLTIENPAFDRIPTDDEYPLAESLKSTVARTISYWNDQIEPKLKNGKNLLIVAHENSLRGIIQHLDGLTPKQCMDLVIPTGIPFKYELDSKLKPIVSRKYLNEGENKIKENSPISSKLEEKQKDKTQEKPKFESSIKTATSEDKPKKGIIAGRATEMLDVITSLTGKDRLSQSSSKADTEKATTPSKLSNKIENKSHSKVTEGTDVKVVRSLSKDENPKSQQDKDSTISVDKKVKVDKSQPKLHLEKEIDKTQAPVSPLSDESNKSGHNASVDDLKVKKSQPKVTLDKDVKIEKSQPKLGVDEDQKILDAAGVNVDIPVKLVEEKNDLLLNASKGKLSRSKKTKDVDMVKDLQPLAEKQIEAAKTTTPIEAVEDKIPDEM